MTDLTGLFIGIAPFVALLLWCEVRGRRRDQADGIRAEIHAARAARHAAGMARAGGATVRMVYISALPSPRVDKHDRIVADTDRKMARITTEAGERLARLAWEFDDVPVDGVVRFGPLGAELSIEVEVFGADLVALAAPRRQGLRDRFRAWYLARVSLGSKVPLILLPRLSEGANARPRERVALPVLR